MDKKRDRSSEMQVYISKAHHAALKHIAGSQGRTMRSVLERWIDNTFTEAHGGNPTLPK